MAIWATLPEAESPSKSLSRASWALFLLLRPPLSRQPLRLGDLGGAHQLDGEITVFGSIGVTSRSRKIEPFMGFNIVLGHVLAFAVHEAEGGLGIGKLLGGMLIVAGMVRIAALGVS